MKNWYLKLLTDRIKLCFMSRRYSHMAYISEILTTAPTDEKIVTEMIMTEAAWS